MIVQRPAWPRRLQHSQAQPHRRGTFHHTHGRKNVRFHSRTCMADTVQNGICAILAARGDTKAEFCILTRMEAASSANRREPLRRYRRKNTGPRSFLCTADSCTIPHQGNRSHHGRIPMNTGTRHNQAFCRKTRCTEDTFRRSSVCCTCAGCNSCRGCTCGRTEAPGRTGHPLKLLHNGKFANWTARTDHKALRDIVERTCVFDNPTPSRKFAHNEHAVGSMRGMITSPPFVRRNIPFQLDRASTRQGRGRQGRIRERRMACATCTRSRIENQKPRSTEAFFSSCRRHMP